MRNAKSQINKNEIILKEKKSSEKQTKQNLFKTQYFSENNFSLKHKAKKYNLEENNKDISIVNNNTDQTGLPFHKADSGDLLKENTSIATERVKHSNNELLPQDDSNKKKLFNSTFDNSNIINNIINISNTDLSQPDNKYPSFDKTSDSNIPESDTYIKDITAAAVNFKNKDNNKQLVEISQTETNLSNNTTYDDKYGKPIVNNNQKSLKHNKIILDKNRNSCCDCTCRKCGCNCDKFCFYCCDKFCTSCLTALCIIF